MMKRICMISCLIAMVMTIAVFGDPGDVLIGKAAAVWRVMSYIDPAKAPTGIPDHIVTTMAAMPDAYVATTDVQIFTGWLTVDLALTFGKVFPPEVYTYIVYSIVYYQYGTPEIVASRAAPTCATSLHTITCDEDPTGQDRGVVLWRFQFNVFTEQDLVASGISLNKVGDKWVFSTVPTGVTNIVVAYDDLNVLDTPESFPTLLFTTE